MARASCAVPGQDSVTEVSSRTNEVCSETSSVPTKLIAAVPVTPPRTNTRWTYPAAWLRFENVPRVVPLTATVTLSKAVVVVVSAVSMCSQKLSVAVQPAGMLTVWATESVCCAPYPSIQASNEPERAGSEADELITPLSIAQDAGPDSK